MRDSAFHHSDKSAAEAALLQQLSDPDATKRGEAAWDLRKFPTHTVVRALAKALSDNDPYVAGNALCALANLGAAAKPAVPELTRLLKDDDRSQRWAAFFALELILGIRAKLPSTPCADLNELHKLTFPPFMTN